MNSKKYADRNVGKKSPKQDLNIKHREGRDTSYQYVSILIVYSSRYQADCAISKVVTLLSNYNYYIGSLKQSLVASKTLQKIEIQGERRFHSQGVYRGLGYNNGEIRGRRRHKNHSR